MDRISQIFEELKKINQNPTSDLVWVNNYTMLVAVVLSAQATDKSVNIATKDLFKTYNTPQKIIELGEEGLKSYIKTIGLFNSKAKNVISLSHDLIEKHGGEVPNNREALEALSGVGRKTANVVLAIAFGHKTIAVDTHVKRVSNRLGFSEQSDPLKIEKDLMRIVPDKYMDHAHHWLILHGRYTCVARKPKCESCIIVSLCGSKDKRV